MSLETYKYDEGDGIDLTFVTGLADVAYSFGPVGVQLGIGRSVNTDYSQDWLKTDAANSFMFHIYHDLSEQTRIGLMLGDDTYEDDDFTYGLEVLHSFGRAEVEARIARFDSEIEPARLFEIFGRYDATEALNLRAGYQRVNYEGGFGYFEYTSIGASYEVVPGLDLYANLGRTMNDFGTPVDRYDGREIAIGATWRFGGAERSDRMFNYNPFF
ncbi:MAG: porin [Vannielia sp.]|uniref:porin n=1 Tax=Vannielia sp. TaxID=2813045 RepID=UPI003B8C4F0C